MELTALTSPWLLKAKETHRAWLPFSTRHWGQREALHALSKHRQADIQMKTTQEGHGAPSAWCISMSRQRPHIVILFLDSFCLHQCSIYALFLPGGPPAPFNTHIWDVSIAESCSYKHSLWIRALQWSHDWNSKWPSQRLTHSSKSTCQLVSEELGSSLGSVINQLHDSGQEPISCEFQFPLGSKFPTSTSEICQED